MAGIGDSWGTREELLHPRDSHGRFRTKWKMGAAVLEAVLKVTENFRPRTFQSDSQATQYTQNLAHKKPGRFNGGRGYARLQADFFNANEDLLDGNPDEPSTKRFVQMMDDSMIELPEDIITSQVVPPAAFGLTPERLPELEEMTGNVIANRGYGAVNMGTPLGGGQGQITMSIATPKGTKMAIPGRSGTDRAMFYDRDQEFTVTKVKPDGRGGYYVWAVATPKTAGENPAPEGTGHAGPGKPPDREAAVTALENMATKRMMGEQAADQLPGGVAAGGTPLPPGGAPSSMTPEQERATRRAAILGRPAQAAPQEPAPAQAPAAPGTAPQTPPPSTPAPAVPEPTPEAGNVPSPTPVAPAAPAAPAVTEEPPNGATSVVTGTPATSFREAVTAAGLESPSAGSRRREWNSAFMGITSGKQQPQDMLRELEADIATNKRAQETENGRNDAILADDIAKQEKLADLIRSHFTLGKPAERQSKAEVRSELDAKAAKAAKKASTGKRPGGGRDEPATPTERGAPAKRLAKDAEPPKTTQEERGKALVAQREQDQRDDELNAEQRTRWQDTLGPEPKNMTSGDILLDEMADLLRNGRITRPKAAARLREAVDGDDDDQAKYLRKVADTIEADTSKPAKRVPLKKAAPKAAPNVEAAEAGLAGRTDKNILTGLNGLPVGDMRALAEKWGVDTRGEDKKLKLKSALAKELAAKWKATPELQRKKEGAEEAGPVDDLDNMTVLQMKEYAKANGFKVSGALRKDAMRDALKKQRDGGGTPEAPAAETPPVAEAAKKAAPKAAVKKTVKRPELNVQERRELNDLSPQEQRQYWAQRKRGNDHTTALDSAREAVQTGNAARAERDLESLKPGPTANVSARSRMTREAENNLKAAEDELREAERRADAVDPDTIEKDELDQQVEFAREKRDGAYDALQLARKSNASVGEHDALRAAKTPAAKKLAKVAATPEMPAVIKRAAAKAAKKADAPKQIAPGVKLTKAAKAAPSTPEDQQTKLRKSAKEANDRVERIATKMVNTPEDDPAFEDLQSQLDDAQSERDAIRADLIALNAPGSPVPAPVKAARKVAKKAAPATPAPAPSSPQDVMARLQDFDNPPSREEATELVGQIKKRAELVDMARQISLPGVAKLNMAELRRALVEGTAGRRLESIATRGFREARPGPIDIEPGSPEDVARLAVEVAPARIPGIDTAERERLQARAREVLAEMQGGRTPDEAISRVQARDVFEEIAKASPENRVAMDAIRREVAETRGPEGVPDEERVAAMVLARMNPKVREALLAEMPEAERRKVIADAEKLAAAGKRVKSGGPDIDRILSDAGIASPTGSDGKLDYQKIKTHLDAGDTKKAQAEVKRLLSDSDRNLKELQSLGSDQTLENRELISQRITDELARSDWLRSVGAVLHGGPEASPELVIPMEMPAEIAKAPIAEFRRMAKQQGVKLPPGRLTRDQIMTELVRDMARRQAAGQEPVAQQAEFPTPPKTPPKPKVEHARIPVRELGVEGFGTGDDKLLDSVQRMLDGDREELRRLGLPANATPAAIGRKIDTLAPHNDAAFHTIQLDQAKRELADATRTGDPDQIARAQAHLDETQAVHDGMRERSARWHALADKLKKTRRTPVKKATKAAPPVKQTLARAAKATPTKAAPSNSVAGALWAQTTAAELRGAETEDAGRKILATLPRTKAAHQQLATALGAEFGPKDTIPQLKEAILRQGVTRRLEHDAFQRQAKPVTATPEASAAPAKAVKKAAKATAPAKATPAKASTGFTAKQRQEFVALSPAEQNDYLRARAAGLKHDDAIAQARPSAPETPAAPVAAPVKAVKKATKKATPAAAPELGEAVEARRVRNEVQAEVATKAPAPNAPLPEGARIYTRAELEDMGLAGIKGLEDQRGIKFKSVARDDRIDVILAQQEAAAGPAKATKKAVKKAAPPKASGGGREHAYAQARDEVEQLSKEKPEGTRILSGTTEEVLYPGGRKLIRKSPGRIFIGEGDARIQAEELAPQIHTAMGLRAPAVTSFKGMKGEGLPHDGVYMQHMPGRVGREVLGGDRFNTDLPPEIYDSDDGVLLGLADTISRMTDRHPLNWLYDDDKRIVPIDNEDSFHLDHDPEDEFLEQAVRYGLARGNFSRHFVDENGEFLDANDLSPRDVAVLRTRLLALRPQFAQRGREKWFDEMMTRFERVALGAKGTKRRVK